jgi:hypothetical protein
MGGDTVVAHYRRRAGQIETSAELPSVEIAARQSKAFTGADLFGESPRIQNVSRQINRRMQAHRSVNLLSPGQFVKCIKSAFGPGPRTLGRSRTDLVLEVN